MSVKAALIAGFCEFVASFLLVGLGCMGILNAANLHIGINYGALVTVIYECFSICSGGFINPCVTVAAIIMKRINWKLGLVYILFQFLGAIVGILFADIVSPEIVGGIATCVTSPNAILKSWQALAFEFAFTSTWILVMCSIWDKRADPFKESVSLRLGLTVSCVTITGYALTGASMNPARSLAAAVINGKYEGIWIYFVGPLLAALTMPFAWLLVYSAGSADDTVVSG